MRLRELRFSAPDGRLTGTALAQRPGWPNSKVSTLELGKQTATVRVDPRLFAQEERARLEIGVPGPPTGGYRFFLDPLPPAAGGLVTPPELRPCLLAVRQGRRVVKGKSAAHGVLWAG